VRIRTIKPEFFLHEGLFELEHESSLPVRLAFTGLWCIADREGRFKWEPRKIGVQVLPYDSLDFSRVLDALTTRGFVRKYSVDSVEYGWIPSFSRHQVINNRERPSELPEPTEYDICDACPTREPRVPHAGKAEGKGREQERKGTGKEAEDEERQHPLDFEEPKAVKFNPNRIAKFEEVLKLGRGQLPPVSDECCEKFFDRMEGDGWINKQGFPLADWRPRFREWANAWVSNSNSPNRKSK